jgi:hypothetical protein
MLGTAPHSIVKGVEIPDDLVVGAGKYKSVVSIAVIPAEKHFPIISIG